jgi:protein involved in temperature-dependent protein secretion
MQRIWILALAASIGCGGNLSDEQRRQLRESREQQTIVKVSEADLLAAAFEQGRALGGVLQQGAYVEAQLDSIETANNVVIRWLELSESNAKEIEKQIIEAYLAAITSGRPLTDNVQRVGKDSILYTLPMSSYRSDSILHIEGVWNIWMSTKQIVLGMHHP